MNLKDHVKFMEPSGESWAPKGPLERQIIVLMSGGVDSSVTAHMLREAGWEILGVTMKIPTFDGQQGCGGADAAAVSRELGLCHYVLDVTAVFSQCVIEPFQQAYQNGSTPNPCVDCNKQLKFGLLWDLAQEVFGIQSLATGHYARIISSETGPRLARGLDHGKDQSYFLYGIRREKLPYLHLPLGDYEKDYTRDYAARMGLTVADKAESMELCFAGADDYRLALNQEQRHQPGPLTDMSGQVIGEHKGVANYTLGQRRGLGFAGGKPLYVGKINPATNTVALGTRDELNTPRVAAEQLNILIPELFQSGQTVRGKIRSYGDPNPCRIVTASEDQLEVDFDQDVFAPCPGQRLVLYADDDSIIAGGVIVAGV